MESQIDLQETDTAINADVLKQNSFPNTAQGSLQNIWGVICSLYRKLQELDVPKGMTLEEASALIEVFEGQSAHMRMTTMYDMDKRADLLLAILKDRHPDIAGSPIVREYILVKAGYMPYLG